MSKLFTLSGGHLFSIYDGCREEGIEIVDVRHESTAAFAAEGWAKVTREAGVCALTAGRGDERDERDGQRPVKPLADARARRARARDALGAGLAAGDRPRPVRAAADQAGRAPPRAPRRSRAWWTRRFAAALAPHGGPTFVDFPLDYVFMEAPEPDGALRADRPHASRRGRQGDRAGGRAVDGRRAAR